MSEIRPYFDYDSLIGRYKPRCGTIVRVEPSPIGEKFVIIFFDNKSFTDVHIHRLEDSLSKNSRENKSKNRKLSFKNIGLTIIIVLLVCLFLFFIIRTIILIIIN